MSTAPTMPKPPKPKPAPKPKPEPPPEITQDELVQYRRLHARLKILDEDVSERRRSLIDRLRRHAVVERGKWVPHHHPQEARQFSLEVVEAAIGTEAARAILAAIKPTVRWSLSVDPDESA